MKPRSTSKVGAKKAAKILTCGAACKPEAERRATATAVMVDEENFMFSQGWIVEGRFTNLETKLAGSCWMEVLGQLIRKKGSKRPPVSQQ